ncbi:Transcription factor unc-3, partial [Geodia barretti]
MRKSNFFHFVLHLADENQAPIEVERGIFKDFHDFYANGQEYRNGLVYTLNCLFRDGTRKEQELCVRLIDSSTKQLIPYEGTCKNPDFRRVLLTHELICSRCLEHRSCGNKNDTPSDPVIIDRYVYITHVHKQIGIVKRIQNSKQRTH